MNTISIKHHQKEQAVGLGTVYFRTSVSGLMVVMITGEKGNYIAVDLEDGVPWFAREFRTLKEIHEALKEDSFSLVPSGSVLEMSVH